MWNGPSTVDSVPVPPARWLIVSTSIETPSTSESRMNSWRTSSHVWPVRVRNPIAAAHSSSVSSTSLTNACRWWTREVMTSLRRGSSVSAKLAATASAEPSSLNSTGPGSQHRNASASVPLTGSDGRGRDAPGLAGAVRAGEGGCGRTREPPASTSRPGRRSWTPGRVGRPAPRRSRSGAIPQFACQWPVETLRFVDAPTS